MKFSIQNALLGQMMKRISPVLVKAKDPSDLGQYIVITATKDSVSMMVSRQDVVVKATVDAGDLVKVFEPGTCTVNGEKISRMPSLVKVSDKITLETKASSGGQAPAADGEEASPVNEAGQLIATYPGHKGDEFFEFPYVDLSISGKIEVAEDTVAEVSGKDFISYIKQVGIAVGESTMSDKFTNVLFRVGGERIDLATTNGQQLAWAKFRPERKSKDFMCVVSYDGLLTLSKTSESDHAVSVFLSAGEPRALVTKQAIRFGGNPVGVVQARIPSTSDSFVQFEKKLESLSFRHQCKIKRQQAKECFDKACLYDKSRSTVAFDKENELITVRKTDAKGRALATLPISAAQGENLELDLSSRHILVGIDASSSEELELKFSGKKSMAVLQLEASENASVQMYFMPFGELGS